MLAAWALELFLITLRDLNVTLPGNLAFKSQGHSVGGLPLPADYFATVLIFTPLAVLSETRARNVANLLAWAWVLATLLNALDPTDPAQSAKGSTAQAVASGTPTFGQAGGVASTTPLSSQP